MMATHLVRFSLLLVSFCYCWPCAAQQVNRFYIPPEHRVHVPGACLWSTIESVGLTHGHTQVRGLAAARLRTGQAAGTENAARTVLTARSVPYTLSPQGTHDVKLLRRMAPSGAIVTVKTKDPTKNHAIVVIGFPGNNRLEYWNSTAPGRIMSGPVEPFLANWRGNVLAIQPKPLRPINYSNRR